MSLNSPINVFPNSPPVKNKYYQKKKKKKIKKKKKKKKTFNNERIAFYFNFSTTVETWRKRIQK